MLRAYAPPPGYLDQPFSYIFDGSNLTDGSNPHNNLVYVEGGLGDFILRRIVGFDTVLNPATGQFQVEDDFLRFIQGDPVFVQGGGEVPIIPELRYRELGAVRFDMNHVLRSFNTDLSGNPIYTAQVAFQGVRRFKSNAVLEFPGKFKPKTFTYRLDAFLSSVATSTIPANPLRFFVKIDDYDFELYDVKIIYQAQATGQIPGAG